MTARTRISIVMPVYNAEGTLAASIASIRAQSYTGWELILIDDGSTDISPHIAHMAAQTDSRITVHRQKNCGPSQARNLGIDMSSGSIVAFLDADDRWSPDRLADMLNQFRARPQAGVLFSRTQFVDTETGQYGALSPHWDQLTAGVLLAENPVCSTSNIVCRRKVIDRIGKFREGLDFAEDQDWLLRVALDANYDILGINSVSFYYASAPDSQSADLQAMHAGWLKMADSAALAHAETIDRLRPRAYAKFLRYLARRALRLRQGNAAVKYILLALRQDPFLIFKQPKRTGLTLIGALMSRSRIIHLQELAAR